MKVLFVSEYDARGSGYSGIADGILAELERRDHKVLMLAWAYDGSEHPHRSAIVATDQRMFPRQIQAAKLGFQPDVLAICYDLTMHERLAWLQRDFPTIGIFPIEADPLCHPHAWTAVIDTMDVALCESRFGTKLLMDAGLRATYFPVGINTDHWRPPEPDEREKARREWGVEDRFCVLTICDNHERKNLPAMLDAFARLRHQVDNAFLIVNTKRRPSSVGYDVPRLLDHFGVQDDTLLLQHEVKGGLDGEQLRSLYWAADAFLLLSKAEGLGLPVLEAMGCGVPVVAGAWTGTGESIAAQNRIPLTINDREVMWPSRGFAVRSEYAYIDPFGNQLRRLADTEQAAFWLRWIHKPPQDISCTPQNVAAQALAYVRGFTWERAGQVLEDALSEAVARRAI